MINVLIIGDLVGQSGVDLLGSSVHKLKVKHDAHVVIANGENAYFGKGLSEKQAISLRSSGVHMITSGNHIWHQKNRHVVQTLPNFVLRPHNYPKSNIGSGIGFIDFKHYKIAVVNLIGRTFMGDQVDNPFEIIEKELMLLRAKTKLIIVDFHAETTSEKISMGHFLDGRVSCVVGTHTHVQTADESLLPKGTAYITDLGMTGPYDSVIGMSKDVAIQRFLTGIPHRYELAEHDARLSGVLVQIDEDTGVASHIERIHYTESQLNEMV